jgi:acetyl-CoA carboxylase carboxyl transferase subunit beta
MNWLTNYVLPKIRALTRKDVPDNLWRKCPACEQMLFHRDLAANLDICHHCGHHFRIGSEARFKMLFDGGAFSKIELPRVMPDPLRFRDRKRYTERLREGQTALGAGNDAVAVAEGRIGGIGAVVAAFDFAFMGGSMGMAVGEALVAAARRAVEREAALIVVPASGGARMQEGVLSLMQMPRTILAADMVKESGLPYIVILTDPTTGGVSASFAMIGDFILAEPGAVIGFAGARVIEETIREKLPERFQSAEYLYEHGMVDQVVTRGELPATLARILSLLREPHRADAATAAPAEILPPLATRPAGAE